MEQQGLQIHGLEVCEPGAEEKQRHRLSGTDNPGRRPAGGSSHGARYFFRYELVNANAAWIEGDDMLITVILTLIMCVLLFLMVWSAVCFLPWKGLMDFFPEDIKEKAIDHNPPFETAPGIRLDMHDPVHARLYRRDRLWRLGWCTKRLYIYTVPCEVFDYPVRRQGV